jgi:hypothetical protein
MYAEISGQTIVLTYPKGIHTDQVTIFLVDNETYGTTNNVSYVLNVTIIDHPEVVGNTPTGVDVVVTTPVVVTFDMEMNRTKTENAFSMMMGAIEVNGTFAWNVGGTVMTFTPADHLTSARYDVTVAASAETVDGIKMLSAFRWNFTAALGTFDGDGDGMTDEWEMENGLDPNVDDADDDADGDGMPNIYEYENDLDPQVDDADEDADGDGATNLDEYEAGTSANDPNDTPEDSSWIIYILVVVVIVVVVVALLFFLRRGKKPAEQTMSYQEFRELKPEVPQEQGPANQQAPPQGEQPPAGGQPPSQ